MTDRDGLPFETWRGVDFTEKLDHKAVAPDTSRKFLGQSVIH
jgi:hypothetical protein